MTDSASLKMPRWLMGQDPYTANDPINYVTHLQSPRFTARWCFGEPPKPPIDKDCIYVEDGEGDAVHVYDFVWLDEKPNQQDFDDLLNEAVLAVDQWLENNMAPPMRDF